MDIVILTSIQLFGQGLASFFNTRQNVSVVAVAQSISMLFEAMSRSKVDLALIDVTQGIDFEEVRSLANQWPTIALIAIGLKADQKEIVRCGRRFFRLCLEGCIPRPTS